MSQTCRLTATLAADVVGYSRLMGEDEEGRSKRLKTRRRPDRPEDRVASRPHRQFERPLSVQLTDLRRDARQRARCAESGQLKVAADDASCGAPARPVAGSSLNCALRSR